ncbi:hypothetical protein [Oceanobacillus sp. CAU 1775]
MKNLKKFRLILFLFLFVTFGSMSIVYANESIENLLGTWFKDKTAQSIERIDVDIKSEQVRQTRRLKEELDAHFKQLEEQLDRFVEAESQKRVLAIQAYANQKIAAIAEIENNEELKKDIIAELDAIYHAAIQAIEAVGN